MPILRSKNIPLVNAGAVALLTLVGCAGVPSVLPPDALAKMDRTHARSYVPQSEVTLQFMQSGYGAGLGLVGAIVDLSVNSAMAGSAESRAKKLRETVRDLNVREVYWTAVTNELAHTPWLKLETVDLLGTNFVAMKAVDVKNGSALTMGSSYLISADTRVLQMTTGFDVYVPGKHKKPAASVILTSHSSEISRDEGDKALNQWMADNGAAYRRAVQEAVAENGRMLRIALDLMGGATNTTHRPMKIRAKLVHGRGEFGIPTGRQLLVGAVVDETDTRVTFRTTGGFLYSFPKSEVEFDDPNAKRPKPTGRQTTQLSDSRYFQLSR